MIEAKESDDIIVATNLVKKYGEKYALDGIDLRIKRGEIFGFLGPNGAGKTTTVRILSTLTDYDKGSASIDGFDIKKCPTEAKVRIGVIQQSISLDKDLTVWENMNHRALMYQMTKKERVSRIEELTEYFSLSEYLDRKIDSLSGGWKKRVAIVCTMVHSPTIVFLDEPTVGLDIKARRLLWDLIRLLNKKGTTVFLTTHYIEEAENLCDRVGIIDEGEIIALGTPEKLSSDVGKFTVEYTNAEGQTTYEYFQDMESASVSASKFPSGEVLMRKTNLEDCFVELTGKKVGG